MSGPDPDPDSRDLAPSVRSGRRVVLVLRHFTVGGLERVLLSHVEVLHAAGFQVVVAVLEPGRDNALIAELHPQVQLVIAPRARVARIGFFRRLVRDAVVLIQFGDGRLYPSLRPGLRGARSVIRFCHSDYSHLRFAAKNRLDRLLSQGEDRIVAVGGRSTRFLTDDVGVPAGKVTTLVNAIDPGVPSGPAPAWPWAKDPYLVAVQSLYPHKGHDSLLKGFAEVVAAMPTARLVVVGDGSETIALYELARSLGITERVTWLGAIWRHDIVGAVLDGAHAFVSMSRFEGVPISILEARRYGLPLVVTDIPGHRDAIADTGVFVPVDDTQAFAKHALAALRAERPANTADKERLREEWRRYREQLVDIVDQPWAHDDER